jgi:hypothetical protein
MFDSDYGHWLAGFIAAEGSFTIIRRTDLYRGRPRTACRVQFLLGLRDDDTAVLQQVRETTGIGSLQARVASGTSRPKCVWCVRNKADVARPKCVWRVQSKPDVRGLVSLLDAHPLRSKKAADFALWREAVLYWCTLGTVEQMTARRSGRTYDWGPIPRLAAEIRAGRIYQGDSR